MLWTHWSTSGYIYAMWPLLWLFFFAFAITSAQTIFLRPLIQQLELSSTFRTQAVLISQRNTAWMLSECQAFGCTVVNEPGNGLALMDLTVKWGETTKVDGILHLVSSLKKNERVLWEKIMGGRLAGKTREASLSKPHFPALWTMRRAQSWNGKGSRLGKDSIRKTGEGGRLERQAGPRSYMTF